MQLNFLFIIFACLEAIFDFDFPISLFLNKNCLFKLDVSIKSLSVIVVMDLSFIEIPIKAKILRNSHPNAPAPIINIFKSFYFF